MNPYVDFANQAIADLKKVGKSNRTGEIRKLSAKIHRQLKGIDFHEKMDICESFLEERTWALKIIGFDLAFRERKKYTLETFDRFEKWLFEYVNDWGDCDDFGVHALGAIIMDYPELYDRILIWCSSDNFAVRREAAVCLIYSARNDVIDFSKLTKISDMLMDDDHYLVQKGYGWMLKEYSVLHPSEVETYLKKNVQKMTRTAYRYAIEKMERAVKQELMSL
jgi:3-methyladenine DNA glycosylase AlkD